MAIPRLNTETELVDFLVKANKAYRDGQPFISDSEYDTLESQLKQINPDHPFLQKVNDEDFGKEKPLTIHMGSQNKALTFEELQSFFRNTNQQIYNISEKLDGMSAELTYKEGFLVQGLSRGDGTYGADITHVVKIIPTVPLRIDAKGITVVRGELLLTKESLQILNQELESDQRETYANPRNGAVALVKTLKNIDYAGHLSFRAFDLLEEI